MKKLIHWISASLEGTDGRSSAKALTLMWLVVLSSYLHYAYIKICYKIVEQQAPTEASLKTLDRLRDLISIDWTVMLILFGVATVAMLIQLFKAFRGQPTDEPILIEKVTKTSVSQTEISNKPKSNEEVPNTNTAPTSDS